MTTRSISVRRISRRVVQSAASRLLPIDDVKSSKHAKALRNVACSRESCSSCATCCFSFTTRWRARCKRGSNSPRSSTPSLYASIKRATLRSAAASCFFSEETWLEPDGAANLRLVLFAENLRMPQQLTGILPHRFIQLVSANLFVLAHTLAAEAIRVGTNASIIGPLRFSLRTTATDLLTVERVAAAATFQ